MTRYNSSWGSHDQLQDLRKANMMMDRTISELRKEVDEHKGRIASMHDQLMELQDELYLAREALRREMPDQK